jgi:hypothetical protein
MRPRTLALIVGALRVDRAFVVAGGPPAPTRRLPGQPLQAA